MVDRILERAGPALSVISHTLGGLGAAEGCSLGGAIEPPSSGSGTTEEGQQGQGGAAGVPHATAAPDTAAAAAAGAAGAAAGPGREWVTAADLAAWGAEPTRHGWLLLPDATGWGPMYVCVLEKVASSDLRRVKVNKYATTAGH